MSFRCLELHLAVADSETMVQGCGDFSATAAGSGMPGGFAGTGFRFGEAAEVLEQRLLLSTIVVDDDGAGDQTTIQDAIDAATAGDLILVTGGADRIQCEDGIDVDKNVTIQGAAGPSQVIVQGAGLYQGTRIFNVHYGTTATIDNLTISNGWILGYLVPPPLFGYTLGDGGGIYNRGR